MTMADKRIEIQPIPELPGCHVITRSPWNPEVCITLFNGREIWLTEYSQHRTYEGLLEGYPCDSVNVGRLQSSCKSALVWANRHHDLFERPCLIKPEVHSHEIKLPDPRSDLGPCRAYPGVTTYAIFDSGTLTTDEKEEPFSSVLFVWLQDCWGLPSESSIAGIRGVDWDAYGKGWNY